ncbi:MAG: class I SAM-dependent methyltransferase [Anaerolineales bacterium]|nr:class I SAM-dependent methyltransferase [Anaerolineales bacterium]
MVAINKSDFSRYSVLQNIPLPDTKAIAARIRPEAERAVRSGHPWVYSDSILDLSRKGRPGDIVVLFDRKNRFLAVGLLDPAGPITVRVLQFHQPADINQSWYQSTLARALKIRKPLNCNDEGARTTGCRLVHGENDGLPGLVIDRYADSLVVKIYTSAWLPHLHSLLTALEKLQSSERVVLRIGRGVPPAAYKSYGLQDGHILEGFPLTGPVLFSENGLTFEADLVHGQKTGFFLDQRDNRSRVEGLASGKSILNLFSYSGGFSVYAARGGARSIVSIDTCAASNAAAQRNMSRSTQFFKPVPPEHTILEKDVFTALAEMAAEQKVFDLIIADPPAFARTRKQVELALKMYARLTRNCLKVLKPGGLLVQASCSSPVSSDDFFQTVTAACAGAKRNLQEIERTGHALDHPVTFSEGSYLKCLFARVY